MLKRLFVSGLVWKSGMKFLEAKAEIVKRFPDHENRFHVIAARWLLGVETQETIEALVMPPSEWSKPRLSYSEARIIVNELTTGSGFVGTLNTG